MSHAGLDRLRDAAAIVYRSMSPTPAYPWPLLREATGVECWVKHENHTPIGAFKLRGGLVYLERLRAREPELGGLISATRGNHGQSLAFACARQQITCVIVVPHGNAREKNAAMRALGAELIEYGRDFDEARSHACQLAAARGLHFVPSFHPDLVEGVASYALELFEAAPALDAVYVPIGLGSGICGVVRARDALGLSTRVVGVVAQGANAYALSFHAGKVLTTPEASTMADGMAVRVPDAAALDIIRQGVAAIVEVDDAAIEHAIRMLLRTTHNLSEGAGAAPLAALLEERETMQGKRVGLILCGANIDSEVLARVLGKGDEAA
ncbi:MAG: threonine dehydratase [Betaproteobacteria bacterium]